MISKISQSIYNLRGTFLSMLHVITYLFPTGVQWDKYHYYPPFGGVGSKAK